LDIAQIIQFGYKKSSNYSYNLRLAVYLMISAVWPELFSPLVLCSDKKYLFIFSEVEIGLNKRKEIEKSFKKMRECTPVLSYLSLYIMTVDHYVY
jgi:hypothetical protein